MAPAGNDAFHLEGGNCCKDRWVAIWETDAFVPLVHWHSSWANQWPVQTRRVSSFWWQTVSALPSVSWFSFNGQGRSVACHYVPDRAVPVMLVSTSAAAWYRVLQTRFSLCGIHKRSTKRLLLSAKNCWNPTGSHDRAASSRSAIWIYTWYKSIIYPS